jgi:hypothetical protein
MHRHISDQMTADVIGAQAGRIAALIEAVAALIQTHPNPAAFRAQFLEAVSHSTLGDLGAGQTEPMLRGHREVANFLANALPPSARASAAPQPRHH